MSIFSVNYLLEFGGQYWNGGPPPHCWQAGGGIRIFAKPDAEAIRKKLFADDPKIRIVEDE